MTKDPYFFPFDIVNNNELIIGDNYYMKLNNNIIKRFVDKKRSVPVSDLKGIFVRSHIEDDGENTIEYAVFKNVYIMNKTYKPGLCNFMLVRYPNGTLANDDCDNFSDIFRNRLVNEDREVYLAVNVWKFGIPTQEKIMIQKTLEKIEPNINEYLTKEVSKFRGIQSLKGGRKIKRKKTRRSRRLRKHKTKRRY
jgi:hypothetical protein